MKILCSHKGRAVGLNFERCLMCRSWRLLLTPNWHPVLIPLPSYEESVMTRKPVVSSNIKSIGFEDGALEIEFSSGQVYRYTGPKVQVHYDGLMAAKSVGKYFAKEVRFCPETACEQVTTDA